MSNQNQIDRIATINDAIAGDDVTAFLVRYFNRQEREMRASITRELAKMTANATDFGATVSISPTMTDWIASMSATAMLAWSIVDALAVREIPLRTVEAKLIKSVLVLSRTENRTASQDLELTAKGEALYQIDQAIEQAAYNEVAK